jgi:F-type H+-transporting ATPase subunit a
MTLALSSLVLAAADPVAHVVNHKAVEGPVLGMNAWLWSGHIGNLLLSTLILCILGPLVAKSVATGPESMGTDRYVTRGRFAHMVEVICLYLREQVVRPLLGARTDGFMPFLWTVFFFILVNNLLGLIPLLDIQHLASAELREKHMAFVGGTATQSLWVTGVLAVVSALVVNAAGVRELGIGGYLKHLTGGAPAYIWPILVPVEILGTFIKPVALALRLMANMTAGHILMAALFGFVGAGVALVANGGLGGVALGGVITVVSFIGVIAIYFLELFVALLQAFIFMFLTTVFISQLSHHGHDHEHDHGHGHEHAHA